MLSLSSQFLLLAFLILTIPTVFLLFKSFSTDKLDKMQATYERKQNRRDIDRNTKEAERLASFMMGSQTPVREIYNGKSNALMDVNSRVNVNIHLTLIERFNKDELKDLAFNLMIPENSCDPDGLPGDLSRCIVMYMHRFQRTEELRETVKSLRKNTGL